MKRAHKGVYHKMSPKHLDRYVEEFSGRHNARCADPLSQMAGVVQGFEGRRLTYDQLKEPTRAFIRSKIVSEDEQNTLIAELHKDIARWKRERTCLRVKARNMARLLQLHGEHLAWAADGRLGNYGYDKSLPTTEDVRENIETLKSLEGRIAQGERDLEAMV